MGRKWTKVGKHRLGKPIENMVLCIETSHRYDLYITFIKSTTQWHSKQTKKHITLNNVNNPILPIFIGYAVFLSDA